MHSAQPPQVAAEWLLRNSLTLLVLPFPALHFSIAVQGETTQNIYQMFSMLPHVE